MELVLALAAIAYLIFLFRAEHEPQDPAAEARMWYLINKAKAKEAVNGDHRK